MEQNYAQLRQSWPKIRTRSTQIDFPLPPCVNVGPMALSGHFNTQHWPRGEGGSQKHTLYLRSEGGGTWGSNWLLGQVTNRYWGWRPTIEQRKWNMHAQHPTLNQGRGGGKSYHDWDWVLIFWPWLSELCIILFYVTYARKHVNSQCWYNVLFSLLWTKLASPQKVHLNLEVDLQGSYGAIRW